MQISNTSATNVTEEVKNPTVAAATPEERPHHPYSPSTLQMREWCPSFKNRQTKEVHRRTTAGTRAHGVVESGEDDERLSDEDAVAAAECMDFVDQRRRIMEAEAADAKQAEIEEAARTHTEVHGYYAIQELREVHLAVDDRKFPDCETTTSGYVDLVLVNHDVSYAEMFDWKFGAWPVEKAEDNLQGIAYALGLFRKYPTLKTIRFFFKQPLINVTSDHLFKQEDIPALYLRIQTVVARSRHAAETNSYDSARPAVPVCNFCDRLGVCPKVGEFACKVSKKFHPLGFPEELNPSLIQDPQQTTLLLRLGSVLAIWAKAIRAQITNRVIAGESPLPPGQKLQTQRKRELVDASKFAGVALRYITNEEYQATLEPTFGKIEDLISEKAPRGQKTNTVKEFQAALLDSGAVVLGDEFSFLRAVAEK